MEFQSEQDCVTGKRSCCVQKAQMHCAQIVDFMSKRPAQN